MKESINKKALKAGLWYTICNFVIRGINFLTTPVFTRLLSKDDYGAYANYSSWLSLLTILTTLDLYTSVMRAKIDFEDDLDGYVSSIQILGTVFTGICYTFVLLFQSFFEKLFGMDIIYINIMFIYMMVAPSFSILQAKHRQLLQYKAVSALAGISTIGSVLVSLICVFSLENDLFGRIIGSSGTLIVVYTCIFFFNLCKGKKVKIKYWKYALMISLPLIPHVLSGNILGTSDRIMITNFCGTESAALYSVVYSCSLIVMILYTSVNQAWAPWFYEQLNIKNYHVIKKASKVYILLSFSIVFAIMLIGPEIVLLIGGKQYAESSSIVPCIMLGIYYWSLYTFFVNAEIFYKKTFGISVKSIIAAFFNLVTNYLLIPLWGWEAAAYTTLASYFLMLVLHTFAGKRLGTDDYFDRRFFFGIAVIAFGVMMGIRIAYSNILLRFAIVFVVLIIGITLSVKQRDNIVAVIRQIRKRK